MNYKKQNKEILIKFNKTENPKELDEMLYQFEQEMNNMNRRYFLKETENPFIFLLEYENPEELIKEKSIIEKYKIIPVTCVHSNTNYITSTILRKIRHKITSLDTFEVNCHLNTYSPFLTEHDIADEITNQIQTITGIKKNNNNPVWKINIYIVGDITAININKINKNKIEINELTWVIKNHSHFF